MESGKRVERIHKNEIFSTVWTWYARSPRKWEDIASRKTLKIIKISNGRNLESIRIKKPERPIEARRYKNRNRKSYKHIITLVLNAQREMNGR